ncbi:hypothetical protein [Paludibaculum fermentans]|uniref:hypothetical protein n=1 Tax=Paludibaculum fermentans TaxID=1473598 RepID=UPI003EBA81B4
MEYDQLIQLVTHSSEADWLWNDHRSIWTFKPDLNITLRETQRPGEGELRPFAEEWAKQFPDKDARATEYELWYGASFVKEYAFVHVDGFRASLPFPKSAADMTITREQLGVALAVNSGHSYFHEYIKRFTIGD